MLSHQLGVIKLFEPVSSVLKSLKGHIKFVQLGFAKECPTFLRTAPP